MGRYQRKGRFLGCYVLLSFEDQHILLDVLGCLMSMKHMISVIRNVSFHRERVVCNQCCIPVVINV